MVRLTPAHAFTRLTNQHAGDIISLGDLEYELHCPPGPLAGTLPSTRLHLDAPPQLGPPYCLMEVCDV